MQTSTTGAKSDWSGLIKDFDALGANKQREMFPVEDSAKVRRLIQNRVRLQSVHPLLGKYIIGGTAFWEAKHIINSLLNPDK